MTQQQDEALSDLSDEEKKYLWEHGLHEDNIFNNRLNFFIVFESILLSVVGSLYGRIVSTKIILIILISLGIMLTALFGYVEARQKVYYDTLRALHRKIFRTYREAQKQVGKWPISSTTLLGYGVPVLMGLIWIVFLITVIVS